MTKLEKYQANICNNYSLGSHLTLESSENVINEIYEKMMAEKEETEQQKKRKKNKLHKMHALS